MTPDPRRWVSAVVIVPVEKMDTPRGLWEGVCTHPDHRGPDFWRTEMNNAGGCAVALDQHWRAKHDGG
jgi:hypothetical protein